METEAADSIICIILGRCSSVYIRDASMSPASYTITSRVCISSTGLECTQCTEQARHTLSKRSWNCSQSVSSSVLFMTFFRTLLSLHMTICRFVDGYQCFGRLYCLLLQGKRLGAEKIVYRHRLGRTVSMTVRLLSTRNNASNIFQENRHHFPKDSVRYSSRWENVHGKTSVSLSAIFCTEPGRNKPCRDVNTYLPTSTCFAFQKSLTLTLTGLRASVFIYYLSVWRHVYTLSILKMVAAGFFGTSVNHTILHGVTSHRTVT